jgi:hypothetical protein
MGYPAAMDNPAKTIIIHSHSTTKRGIIKSQNKNITKKSNFRRKMT